jgi:peptide/nickel transport system substrate-binding protein
VLNSVASYKALDDQTVEIKTKYPNPILPNDLLDLMIMSRSWSEAHSAVEPIDASKEASAGAALIANGTGPYEVGSRAVGEKTVLKANPDYWGTRGNIDEVVFTPIANAATMVSALLNKEVDLVMPLPLQDVERVKSTAGLKVTDRPETRVVFLGFDMARDELLESSVKGKNPFLDKRVREALRLAIDNELIVDRIMDGMATPEAQMVMDKVTGFDPRITRPAPDLEKARVLLEDAGYGDGFSVGTRRFRSVPTDISPR